MRIRRFFRSTATFLGQLCVAFIKAVVITVVLGVFVVSIMHYVGVPVPSADDLLRGASRLAHVLS